MLCSACTSIKQGPDRLGDGKEEIELYQEYWNPNRLKEVRQAAKTALTAENALGAKRKELDELKSTLQKVEEELSRARIDANSTLGDLEAFKAAVAALEPTNDVATERELYRRLDEIDTKLEEAKNSKLADGEKETLVKSLTAESRAVTRAINEGLREAFEQKQTQFKKEVAKLRENETYKGIENRAQNANSRVEQLVSERNKLLESIAALNKGMAEESTGNYKATLEAQQLRNELLFGRFGAIDLLFHRYTDAMYVQNKSYDLSSHAAILTLAGLGTLGDQVFTATSLRAFAATSGLVSGMKESYDKNTLINQSLILVLATMNAERTRIRAEAVAASKKDLIEFPIEEALSKSESYYRAGTISRALEVLTAAAGEKQTQANTQLAEAVAKKTELKAP
jgi:hypothetical protein